MRYQGSAASDPGSTFPEGDYYLECTAVQDKDKEGNDKKSKNGNDMWVLELTVKEGEFAGRKVWHYLVWLPAGAPGHGMTLRAIHAFGHDPEGDNDYTPDHFLNVTVKAFVKIDPAKDGYQASNKIGKWYVPEGEAAPTGADGGSAAEPEGGDTSFEPPAEEKELAAAGAGPKTGARPAAAKPAPAAAAKPAAGGGKKPLWGGKKK